MDGPEKVEVGDYVNRTIRSDATTISVRIQINGSDYADEKKALINGLLSELTGTAANQFTYGSLASGTFLFEKTLTMEDRA